MGAEDKLCMDWIIEEGNEKDQIFLNLKLTFPAASTSHKQHVSTSPRQPGGIRLAPATSSPSYTTLTLGDLVTFKHTNEIPLCLVLCTPAWLPIKALAHRCSLPLFPTGVVKPTTWELPPTWPPLGVQCSDSLETEYNHLGFFACPSPVFPLVALPDCPSIRRTPKRRLYA